ncbi:MAG: energy transducer TonB [Gallionella sp.]
MSFVLQDATQSTETLTPTARQSVPHEFKQVTVSKVESDSTYSLVSSASVPANITETTAVQASTLSLPDNEPDYLAAYLNNSAPIYPVVARRLGWQGKVLVSVEVLADGRAGQVKLQHSSGHPVLDDAAINAVKDWHFSPARHAGQPVDKWFLVPIPFVLKESE